MAKQWDENAETAKRIAKNIITGDEENKDGVRLIHVVERLDTFATDTLNRKFAQSGSKASIHTYDGERQVIDTHHADGSEGHFDSNGKISPTDNAMDIEVENYINNHLDESKNYKNMKTKKTITESQLRAIVAESVRNVLKETEDRLYGGIYGYHKPNENIVEKCEDEIFALISDNICCKYSPVYVKEAIYKLSKQPLDAWPSPRREYP